MQKIIFLTGAPSATSLEWSDEILTHNFEPRIARFLGSEQNTELPDLRSSILSFPTPLPVWRKPVIRDDDSFLNAPFDAESNYTTIQALADEDREAFLEHSRAALDEIDELIHSTLAEDEFGSTTVISIDGTETSASPTQTSFNDISFSSMTKGRVDRHIQNCEVVNLKAIPKSDHIQRMYPSTLTVDMIVGIINVSPARTVQLRKRKGEMDIVELMVGDDTLAGFTVTFWLSPNTSRQISDPEDMRPELRRLRTGDVVLLRHVALSTFRGRVYGQSLSRRVAKNDTSVVKLPEDLGELSLNDACANKYSRVLQWRNSFLGYESSRLVRDIGFPSKGQGKQKLDVLPTDTPA